MSQTLAAIDRMSHHKASESSAASPVCIVSASPQAFFRLFTVRPARPPKDDDDDDSHQLPSHELFVSACAALASERISTDLSWSTGFCAGHSLFLFAADENRSPLCCSARSQETKGCLSSLTAGKLANRASCALSSLQKPQIVSLSIVKLADMHHMDLSGARKGERARKRTTNH